MKNKIDAKKLRNITDTVIKRGNEKDIQYWYDQVMVVCSDRAYKGFSYAYYKVDGHTLGIIKNLVAKIIIEGFTVSPPISKINKKTAYITVCWGIG